MVWPATDNISSSFQVFCGFVAINTYKEGCLQGEVREAQAAGADSEELSV
jgi:hypothetical protein